MKLPDGKYVMYLSGSTSSPFGSVEYWMISKNQKGQSVICKNLSYPQIIKNAENQIFIDDGVRILKRLELNDQITFKDASIEIHATDQWNNNVVFHLKNTACLKRLLNKFPGVSEIIGI